MSERQAQRQNENELAHDSRGAGQWGRRDSRCSARAAAKASSKVKVVASAEAVAAAAEVHSLVPSGSVEWFLSQVVAAAAHN